MKQSPIIGRQPARTLCPGGQSRPKRKASYSVEKIKSAAVQFLDKRGLCTHMPSSFERAMNKR